MSDHTIDPDDEGWAVDWRAVERALGIEEGTGVWTLSRAESISLVDGIASDARRALGQEEEP